MSLLVLTGCGSLTPDDYAGTAPKLDLRQYLNGELMAYGVLFDYTGKVDRHFTVKMLARWEGNKGTLEEEFIYNDGRQDQRTWTINFSDDTTFTATAHDVIGVAQGRQNGNAVNMKYTLRVTRDNGDTIDLSMDDWMYLVDDKVIINRTKMRKFGVTVGELVISFYKK